MSVFFGETKALTMEEITSEAAELLRTSGHRVEDHFRCTVNVVVGGKDPGCAVIFQDLRNSMLYTVRFDRNGQARIHYAGPVRHDTPKFGAPGSAVPPGGVPVRP